MNLSILIRIFFFSFLSLLHSIYSLQATHFHESNQIWQVAQLSPSIEDVLTTRYSSRAAPSNREQPEMRYCLRDELPSAVIHGVSYSPENRLMRQLLQGV